MPRSDLQCLHFAPLFRDSQLRCWVFHGFEELSVSTTANPLGRSLRWKWAYCFFILASFTLTLLPPAGAAELNTRLFKAMSELTVARSYSPATHPSKSMG